MPEIPAVHRPLMSSSLQVGFRNGCPLGTVPMRRTARENRIQAKAFFKAYPNMILEDVSRLPEESGSYIVLNWLLHYLIIFHLYRLGSILIQISPSMNQKAEMNTRRANATKYYGAHAVLNVYNPRLANKQQFSRMMMKLRFGPVSSFTSLQAGWAVSIYLHKLPRSIPEPFVYLFFNRDLLRNSFQFILIRCFLPCTMTTSPDFTHTGV